MAYPAHTDWKVTTTYRALLGFGWTSMVAAAYLAGAAAVLDSVTIWWAAAVLAASALVVRALLPDPVPREFITGGHNAIGPQR